MRNIQSSELILNSDGSIYHLGLHPRQIGDIIITVGDPQRVPLVSRHFDKIVVRNRSREFVTHTGYIKNKHVSVISTGIGTDNIDIVINELDALVNIDFSKRRVKNEFKQLQLIRIGTTGSIREDIAVDSHIQSRVALGFGGLQKFYHYKENDQEQIIYKDVEKIFEKERYNIPFYVASTEMKIDLEGVEDGITLTLPGFYAPQSRYLRLKPFYDNFIDRLSDVQYQGLKCMNIEMETAGIFTLANLLGHKATSLSAVLANRITGAFTEDPSSSIDSLINKVIAHLRN